MSGYILYLLPGALGVVFWRARAGRTFDQLIDDGEHHHHQVLAISKKHPQGRQLGRTQALDGEGLKPRPQKPAPVSGIQGI